MESTHDGHAKPPISMAAFAKRRADDMALLQSRTDLDPLTGLLSRRAILEEARIRIDAAVTSGELFPALIYVDLDGFKLVNDTYGHAAGDLVLADTAHRMESLVSKVGGSVGRFGGDEFLLVLSGAETNEQLAEINQMLISLISAPIDIEVGTVKLGVSVGAVRARADAKISELLQEADRALYAAKDAGRGQSVISDNEFRDQVAELAEIHADVVPALEKEDFELWFQPIWSDQGNSIAALESLVRWRGRDGRIILPAQFLAILERRGLIGRLDAQLFAQLCRVLAEWLERGRKLVPVHLNVSSSRLEDPNFAAETKAVLAETGVPPELIVLEATESYLVSDAGRNNLGLQQLRQMGVLVAVDDFGTRYSSLSQLKDLPVDILKVDRGIIAEMDHSEDKLALVSAVIGLARELGLCVIAEGVERAEELEFANDNGCHFTQGFLLGRPLPRKETEDLLGRFFSLAPIRGRAAIA